MTSRAPSGARITGDDVQHLIVWYHVLRALVADNGIHSIEVEADAAGNVDDLVVRRSDGRIEYWQVKASVDASSPASAEWLMSEKAKSGSLLSKLYASWKMLSAQSSHPVTLVLATTKNVDPNDAVLRRKDRSGRIVHSLSDETPAMVAARAEWATHVGVSESELLAFLEHLEIRTGIDEHGWLEKINDVAGSAGVRSDKSANALGTQIVRNWVKDPRRVLKREDLAATVAQYGLLARRRALIVAQALDRTQRADDATAALDWVDLFDGDEPRTRRQLVDEADSALIRNEIREVRSTLRSADVWNIEVVGLMRLPLWFLFGCEFGKTTGFTVSASCGSALWSSADGGPGDGTTMLADAPPSQWVAGAPWVVSLNVATDITADVEMYASRMLPTATCIHFFPASGCSRDALQSGADAMRLATELCNRLRELRQTHRPTEIHLFLAAPGAAALFVGYLWDRLPSTTVYWDMNEPGGYAQAFTVKN